MSRKPKFKPEITRVKLNPEQAVLTCTCYNLGNSLSPMGPAQMAPGSILQNSCGANRAQFGGFFLGCGQTGDTVTTTGFASGSS